MTRRYLPEGVSGVKYIIPFPIQLTASREKKSKDTAVEETIAMDETRVERMTHAERVAFDRGEGHRCITHDRTNPYPLERAAERAAWERGWERVEANA
jgi:hypothetical protein